MENREHDPRAVETQMESHTIGDHYLDAIKYKLDVLVLFIDFLVREKKVLTFDDPIDALDYYYQPKFAKKMNEYLAAYQEKRDKERGK